MTTKKFSQCVKRSGGHPSRGSGDVIKVYLAWCINIASRDAIFPLPPPLRHLLIVRETIFVERHGQPHGLHVHVPRLPPCASRAPVGFHRVKYVAAEEEEVPALGA